jgi:hypothetical protein
MSLSLAPLVDERGNDHDKYQGNANRKFHDLLLFRLAYPGQIAPNHVETGRLRFPA